MLDVPMNKFCIPFSEVQRLSGDDDFNQNQLGISKSLSNKIHKMAKLNKYSILLSY